MEFSHKHNDIFKIISYNLCMDFETIIEPFKIKSVESLPITTPESYAKSRKVGIKLSQVMARLMEFQMKNGRYFIVENPEDSEMWNLLWFKAIWKIFIS